jgi:eukaryotic-like serine/threonine-protein kinase
VAVIAVQLRDALRDRYLIEHELGRGGMATVYLARDPKHDRLVALKVLHPELAATVGPERFVREVRLAARLQHPHILPLFDSGESAGYLWYTMPYVEGESLRDRLRREPQLPLDEALRICHEAAQALGYAHEHGVIHRDIKPENMLLTRDGNVLVADFGVARALQGDDALTQTGLALGTPAYMSPEQAAGERTVDAHTDVYSLGCVLYEMLAGEPPYTGPTAQAVVAKRFHAPIPSVRHVRPEMPEGVDHALHRALALSPADRFATVAGLWSALALAQASSVAPLTPLEVSAPGKAPLRSPPAGRSRRRVSPIGAALGIGFLVGVGVLFAWRHARTGVRVSAESGPARLAVLPFRVIGEGQQVWREGMVDLLSMNLDGAAGLTTIHPRTVLSRWHRDLGSSEASADQEAALQVAKNVGARYSVSGTLLTTGSHLRLTAEVQEVRTGAVRGRSSVEGPSDSVPALVDRLSLELLRAGLLGGAGGDSVIPNAGRLTTTSVTALKAYLDGERDFRRGEPEQAEAAFRRAVEADSTFALAHYRLAAATAWTRSPHQPQSSPEDSAALRLADRLPRRDRQLLAAHLALNETNPAAIDMLQELTAQYPEDAEAWYLLGEAYYHLGNFTLLPLDLFRAAERRSISLDPGLTPAYVHLIEDAFFRLDSAGAGELVRRLQAIAPASPKTAGVSFAYALSWGDSSARRQARRAMDTASTLAVLTSKHSTNVSPDLWQQTVTSGLALAHQSRHPSFLRWQGYGGAGMAYILRGRLREGLILQDSGAAVRGSGDWTARGMMYLALLGMADTSTGEQAARRLAQLPGSDPFMLRMMYSAAQHRFDDIERAAKLLERGTGDSAATTCSRVHAKILRAYAAGYREGPRGIPAVREAANLPWVPQCDLYLEPQRLLLIRLLVESGRAEEAVPYFNGFDPFSDWDAFVPLEFYRGRVAEQLGDRQQAIHHYGALVSWLDKADPPLQPMRAEAREALSRLTGEPRHTP